MTTLAPEARCLVSIMTIASDAMLLKSRFDIFQFPFRFNPGTNGGNVEMGLINKSYLLTLNQRVQGSSPSAPTNIVRYLTYNFLKSGRFRV